MYMFHKYYEINLEQCLYLEREFRGIQERCRTVKSGNCVHTVLPSQYHLLIIIFLIADL